MVVVLKWSVAVFGCVLVAIRIESVLKSGDLAVECRVTVVIARHMDPKNVLGVSPEAPPHFGLPPPGGAGRRPVWKLALLEGALVWNVVLSVPGEGASRNKRALRTRE